MEVTEMKRVILPYILTTTAEMGQIQAKRESEGKSKLIEIPVLNGRIIALDVNEESRSGLEAFITKDSAELAHMKYKHGAFHLMTFMVEGAYCYVTNIEYKDGEMQ